MSFAITLIIMNESMADMPNAIVDNAVVLFGKLIERATLWELHPTEDVQQSAFGNHVTIDIADTGEPDMDNKKRDDQGYDFFVFPHKDDHDAASHIRAHLDILYDEQSPTILLAAWGKHFGLNIRCQVGLDDLSGKWKLDWNVDVSIYQLFSFGLPTADTSPISHAIRRSIHQVAGDLGDLMKSSPTTMCESSQDYPSYMQPPGVSLGVSLGGDPVPSSGPSSSLGSSSSFQSLPSDLVPLNSVAV